MSLNAAILSAGASFDLLRLGWAAQSAGKLTASWMLHGRPGVGKSRVVQQLADDIGARLFDVRLTTIEPQDLRGLPYYDHDLQKTVWYRPEDLPDDPSTPSILFLDELTAASPHLQPTVYGLLQERRVGLHRLPDSVMVVAAGNTVEDGAIAFEMGTALSDRLIHIHMKADPQDWLENYAGPKGLAPAVTAFLRARPDLLDTTEDTLRRGDVIACTPRAWERASNILNAIPDRKARQAMIAGTLGDAVASEFSVVADEIEATVHINHLLEASEKERFVVFPNNLYGLNAVVFGLIGAATPHTLPAVIETMEQIRRIADHSDDPAFGGLPLDELSVYGFEMLLTKALKEGWQETFLQSPAYARYVAARRDLGLD